MPPIRLKASAAPLEPQPERPDPRPFCQRCYIRAAEVIIANGKGGSTWLCLPCSHRRRAGAK
jgi:hypothetical protein